MHPHLFLLNLPHTTGLLKNIDPCFIGVSVAGTLRRQAGAWKT
jgi:hypothetical protein